VIGADAGVALASADTRVIGETKPHKPLFLIVEERLTGGPKSV
jgi:hypothetical protein